MGNHEYWYSDLRSSISLMFHNYPHVFTKCISNLRRAETTFPFMMEDTIEDIEDEDLIEDNRR